MKRLIAAASAAIALACAGSASASAVYWGSFTASPGAEVHGWANLSNGNDSLQVNISWRHASSLATGAEFYCCGMGSQAAMVFDGFDTPVGQPVELMQGIRYKGSIYYALDLNDPSIFTADFLASSGGTAAGAWARMYAGMEAGGSYVTLRTQNYAAGEATAMLSVPEPATWAMMIIGFGMAGAVIRRSTQSRAQLPSS